MAAPLTGRKVFAITASAFAIIIGVNVYMAYKAVGTFPGLEVQNSYVASQTFDADLKAQQALGWTLVATYVDGALRLDFSDRSGQPVKVASVQATVGRATNAAHDIDAQFSGGPGIYSAPMQLDPGKWMVLLEARAEDGTRFHQRIDLFVKG